jgi:aspartyl-tRNA(Asn)/glutamyl-tRNA(Gln) amidotransferase subunit B
MPILPQEQEENFLDMGLPAQDAKILAEEKSFAEYFMQLTKAGTQAKPAANWMLGPVKKWLNENNADINLFPIPATDLAALVSMVESGKINFSIASSRVFPEMTKQSGISPLAIAQAAGLLEDINEDQLSVWVKQVLDSMPEKVQEYKKGKKGLIGLFVGEVKRLSKGKADPQKTTALIAQMIA